MLRIAQDGLFRHEGRLSLLHRLDDLPTRNLEGIRAFLTGRSFQLRTVKVYFSETGDLLINGHLNQLLKLEGQALQMTTTEPAQGTVVGGQMR